MANNKKIISITFFIVGLLLTVVAILNYSNNIRFGSQSINDAFIYMIELFIGLLLVAIGIFRFPYGHNEIE